MAKSVPVQLPKTLSVTDEQFLAFVKANPDLRLERTAMGELIAMSPAGSESGNYNSELTAEVVLWNRQHQLGKVFDSSSGFRLPNGAIRAPDVAWVAQSRWDALTPEQRQGFAPLCPDFVIELMSKTDDSSALQEKMREYLDNGCRLGWLIMPMTRRVEIYQRMDDISLIESPSPKSSPFARPLSGETVLPGFVLDLQTIFPDRG